MIEVHFLPGTGRTFHDEVIAVEGIVLQQRPDDQRVDGHPDRSAPVGVATKHAGIGFAGQIRDAVFLAARVEHVGMLRVKARERTDAVRAEEFFFIEHLLQHVAEFGFIQNGAETAILLPDLARIVNERPQFRPRLNESFQAVHDVRILLTKVTFKN